MKLKDYLVIALIIVIAGLLVSKSRTPSIDYSHKYDSLKTVVDRSYQVIESEKRKKLQKAAEITRLNRQIQATQEDKEKITKSYQKRIKSLERLKTPQIDSILTKLYGNPLDSRQIVTDLYRGDQAKELYKLASLEITHLNGVIENQQEIIKSDSVHNSELNKVVAAVNEKLRLNNQELEQLRSENKGLFKTNKKLKLGLKIGVPLAVIIGLFIPA